MAYYCGSVFLMLLIGQVNPSSTRRLNEQTIGKLIEIDEKV